jgi:hypothetical protein
MHGLDLACPTQDCQLGNIGSTIAEEFADQSHDLTVSDRLQFSQTFSEPNRTLERLT